MQRFLSICIATLVLSLPAIAREQTVTDNNVVGFINALKTDNLAYYSGRKAEFFATLSKGQKPLATVVACSDSRVHTNMFSADPEGRLFMVRNMGNQLAATEGSVEYGIYHLHTPVLLIIGHTRCGAISAASSDYSKESPAIRRELDSISIGKGLNNIEGVYANVHNQVVAAMLKFDDELRAGRLNVIGAVLDFADDLHFGAGKLTIINVNGETDAAKLEDPKPLLTKPAGKTKKNVR